jgi:hypothetical protein
MEPFVVCFLKKNVLCAVCAVCWWESVHCVSEYIVPRETTEDLQAKDSTTVEIRPGFSVPISNAHFYVHELNNLTRKGLSIQDAIAFQNLVAQYCSTSMFQSGKEKHATLISVLMDFSPTSSGEANVYNSTISVALSIEEELKPLWKGEVASIEGEGFEAVLVLLNTVGDLARTFEYLIVCLVDGAEHGVVGTSATYRHANVFSAFYKIGYLKTGKMWFHTRSRQKAVCANPSERLAT